MYAKNDDKHFSGIIYFLQKLVRLLQYLYLTDEKIKDYKDWNVKS